MIAVLVQTGHSWQVHRAHRPQQCQHPLSKTIYPTHPISTPNPPPSSNNHNSLGNFSKIDSTSETSIPPSTSPFPPSLFTPSNLTIPLQKVFTPSSFFKVWQSFQARFSLPQDGAPQRQAPRICIYRVRKQRCKCLSPPPSPPPPPRLSGVMLVLRTLLLTLAFPFPITHRMNRRFLKSAIDAVRSPGIRVPVTQLRPVLSCRERKEEADHIALNVGRNEGFNTGP